MSDEQGSPDDLAADNRGGRRDATGGSDMSNEQDERPAVIYHRVTPESIAATRPPAAATLPA